MRATLQIGIFVTLMGALAALPGCNSSRDACCGQPAGPACAGPMDPGGGVRTAINTEPPRSRVVGASACTAPAVVPTAVGGGPRAADDRVPVTHEDTVQPGSSSNEGTQGSPRRLEY